MVAKLFLHPFMGDAENKLAIQHPSQTSFWWPSRRVREKVAQLVPMAIGTVLISWKRAQFPKRFFVEEILVVWDETKTDWSLKAGIAYRQRSL